jgi:hypothetical protein
MPSSHKKVTNIISGIDIPNPEIVNENDGVHASNALALLTLMPTWNVLVIS